MLTIADYDPKSPIPARVVYAYEATRPDELSLMEDAIVFILRKNEDGWYEGVMDGITGLFPGNYVSPLLD